MLGETELKPILAKVLKVIAIVITVVAMGFAIFHLTMGFRTYLDAYRLRTLHLAFALSLAFLLIAFNKKAEKSPMARVIDLMLAGLGFYSIFYAFTQFATLNNRVGFPIEGADLFFGAVTIVLLLEATRRKTGWALPMIAIVFLLYAYFGPYMPETIAHRGFSIQRIISHLYFSSEGIFGVPLGVSAKYVVLFVIFGSVLSATKGGDFFIDLAYSLVGGTRGGPAKAAVVASGFFGSISGAAVANVVTTGQITIPLMKKVGFKPNYAGAVEAVASTGGQLMPPVMGASAFIMAEIIGVSYWNIVVAAIIPAFLYYLAVLIMVDLEAAKTGLRGMKRSELPSMVHTLGKGWPLLLPLILLIVMLFLRYSAQKAVMVAIVSLIVVSLFKKWTRCTIREYLLALKDGAIKAVEIALVCAAAGIVIGVFSLTGLGLKMSALLVSMSQGNLFILLVLTMITSLILGMGMPTAGAYVTLAILVAPALIEIGVTPIAAHFFVFFFGIISTITPPVALAAYAGASLAGGDYNITGLTAFRLGLAAFILPYMFVLGPSLLMMGTEAEILISVVTAILGIASLATSLQGFLLIKHSWVERILFFVSALALVSTNKVTDYAGVTLLLIALVIHFVRRARLNGGSKVIDLEA